MMSVVYMYMYICTYVYLYVCIYGSKNHLDILAYTDRRIDVYTTRVEHIHGFPGTKWSEISSSLN